MSSASSISCNGGTAVVTVSAMDGTGPYTGTGAFTVSAGTYSYTVTDANGCIASTSVTVTEPAVISATTTSTSSNCGGTTGTATVFASGGTGAFTYLWSSNGTAETETGLTASSYTVTITDDNGCISTAVANVSDIGAPTVTSSSVDVSCNGLNNGSIDNNVFGGTGTYTYSWSNLETTEDIMGLTAGMYTYTITDGAGCQSTGSVTITEPNSIDVAIMSSGATITTNNSTATSYQWMDCNSNTIISMETGQSFTAIANGDYAVIITEGFCVDTSVCFNVTAMGMTESEKNEQISIFPNPNSGVFTIKASFKGTYTIANELGQKIKAFDLNADNNYSISIDGLSNGVYFITGINNQQVTNQKIVVAQ